MKQNYDLVSRLRGYKFLKPSFTPILFGYGKPSKNTDDNDDDDDDDDDKLIEDGRTPDERYGFARQSALTHLDPAYDRPDIPDDQIETWVKYFLYLVKEDDSVWNRDLRNDRFRQLNSFIRQIALLLSPDKDSFVNNLERFRVQLAELAQQEVDRIYDDRWFDHPEPYYEYREACKDYVENYLKNWRIISSDKLFSGPFLRFVVDILILITQQPSDFETNYNAFKKVSEKSSEKDVKEHFHENLDDTAIEDLEDLHRPSKRRKEEKPIEEKSQYDEKELIASLFKDEDLKPSSGRKPKKEGYDDDDDDFE